MHKEIEHIMMFFVFNLLFCHFPSLFFAFKLQGTTSLLQMLWFMNFSDSLHRLVPPQEYLSHIPTLRTSTPPLGPQSHGTSLGMNFHSHSRKQRREIIPSFGC